MRRLDDGSHLRRELGRLLRATTELEASDLGRDRRWRGRSPVTGWQALLARTPNSPVSEYGYRAWIEWLDDVVAERDVVEADRLAPDGQAAVERVRRCQCSAQGQVEPDLHPSRLRGQASKLQFGRARAITITGPE